ncbi:nanoRNase/pAp phosphatase, hydrolyzes c-di-AMP and oligoRNAs [Natronoarchaeum philippinense]|uniref:NanoRNase/pAp phosphatase, hydrolyzes c-di-AMP and oligoRNAs n=1 Tax=Natronoarchaeum philippinense TaxID=558529 RepID=A0A285NWQ0_NATPI|nr:DHH family phosphoesterase [Natronoarchaeum philippinense]SNZ13467.1 nanoRNase/pAp phosphatase, hydrolyzes c-di-AMP and oligoRNAs [Natronoarchaeum philippinense]
MVTRLVLGSGAVCQALVERVVESGGRLRVITDDTERIDTLRGDGRRVTDADPTDPETLESAHPDAEVVFVGSDDPARNATIARVARTVYPGALIVAYTGYRPSDAQRRRIDRHADQLIDPGTATADRVLELVSGDTGKRARELRRTLQSIEGPIAVVAHDNPDPDAIASALALTQLAGAVGADAEACYYGDISHQENRALVNLLDLDLRRLDPDDPEHLSEFEGFALVDHSRPGVNDQLPETLSVDVVIDHHPPRGPVDADFVDLRHSVGATSTLLTEYFTEFGLEIDETVATALLYGIRIDTWDFTREVSQSDFEAAGTLVPHADIALLERVESPNVSGDTLETVASAIRNRDQRGSILTSFVGELADRDALAQAADKLLDMDGVTTTVAFGLLDGVVYVSARAQGSSLDLGETLRLAYNQIGSAGGHTDMAGAQIPVGMLSTADEDGDAARDAIEAVIRDRFYDALRERPFELPQEHVSAIAEFDFPLRLADDSGGLAPDSGGEYVDEE